MMTDINRKRLWLIVIVGLILRLTYFNIPILEVDAREQTELARIAEKLFTNPHNFFDMAYFYQGIYPAMISVLYLCAGHVNEILGRLLGIVFSLGTVVYLYRFMKNWMSEEQAVWAVYVYFLSPLAIIYNRTFLPDTAVAFGLMFCLYYFRRFALCLNSRDFICALFGFLFSYLMRSYALFFLIPIGYFIYLAHGKDMWKKAEIYIVGLMALLVFILWSLWEQMMFGYNHSIDLVNNAMTSLDFFEKVIGSFGGKVLTPVGLGVFFVALWKNRGGHLWLRLLSWTSVLILLWQAYLVGLEKFYYFPLLLIGSMYIGLEIGKHNLGLEKKVSPWVKGLLNTVIIISIMVQISTAYSLPEHLKNCEEAGVDLQNYAEPCDLVIGTGNIYYCHRDGWTMSLNRAYNDSYLIDQFERFRRNGAKYFVVTELYNYVRHKDFMAHIQKSCERIVGTERYSIYRIRTRTKE